MMEAHGDFLESFHPDVSSKILMSLDDLADVVRASAVSRTWHDFVITNGICKHLCLRMFPQLSGISRVIDTSDKQEKVTDAGCSRSVELEHPKKEHRAFAALARGLTSSQVVECLSDAIGASSTDNFPEEGVHNTLESRDQIGRSASYWSSSGQSNPEVPERLTYKLISELCVITEVNVCPFQAYFQPDSPIYSAKAVRFHMGHRILPDDDEEDVYDLEDQQSDEENFVWTYTSPEFPMLQENRLQSFKLPEPVICFGGHLQIELLGRVQRQEVDGLLYICVAHVQVMGRSLSPVFGIESHDPGGRFTLTYNLNAQLSSPPSINEEAVETNVAPEMVHRHGGGWEQILNMLRGTMGVEVYDSDDEIA